MWSATNVADDKVSELEYLVVYRVKDDNYAPEQQGSLFGIYKIIGYTKISDNFSKEESFKNHKNYGKYIFFVEKQSEMHKKSPRVYQDRDYMSYEDFITLPNL